MTFDDLKRSAASLQRTEGSRQRLQASTINSIYKKALELDKINSDRLICDVIISKAAEELYSDEKLYLSALKKVTSINKLLLEESEARCATLIKYISKKYDFNDTMIKTEQYFDEKETFNEFLSKIKNKSFYLFISDETLHDVYEMLVSKSLV